MTQSTAPRKQQVGIPSPANSTRRLAHDESFRNVPASQWVGVRAHVVSHRLKRPHRLVKIAWRNLDRTHLATPAIILTAGWVLISPLVAIGLAIVWAPFAYIGYDRAKPRAVHARITRQEAARLAKAVVIAPKVVDHRDCLAPASPLRTRHGRIQLGGAEIVHPKLADLLDKVKPLEDSRPLVSRYNHLRYPPFIDPADYSHMTRTIANVYEQPVHFTTNPHTPGVGTMRIQHVDWLARIAPWEKIGNLTPMRLPIGWDWDARQIWDSIHDQAWLVAGVRGSGKTAFIRGILGRLWDLPNVELWLCDHADDLIDFRPYATRLATSPEDAVALSHDFVELHAKQRAAMVADGRKTVTWPDYPCRIFVVDELAGLTTRGDELSKTFNRNLMIMATQGRKTAHSLLAATQQPNASVIPTDVRGQFTRRLGLRVEGAEDTRMILGSNDVDLRSVPPDQRGRGYWKGEGLPRPIRTPGLYHDDISWVFGDRTQETPETIPQDVPTIPDTATPPTPLFAVPDCDLSYEELLRAALVGGTDRGLTVPELQQVTKIPLTTLYRYVKKPWVEQVSNVQPIRYRLRWAA